MSTWPVILCFRMKVFCLHSWSVRQHQEDWNAREKWIQRAKVSFPRTNPQSCCQHFHTLELLYSLISRNMHQLKIQQSQQPSRQHLKLHMTCSLPLIHWSTVRIQTSPIVINFHILCSHHFHPVSLCPSCIAIHISFPTLIHLCIGIPLLGIASLCTHSLIMEVRNLII